MVKKCPRNPFHGTPSPPPTKEIMAYHSMMPFLGVGPHTTFFSDIGDDLVMRYCL